VGGEVSKISESGGSSGFSGRVRLTSFRGVNGTERGVWVLRVKKVGVGEAEWENKGFESIRESRAKRASLRVSGV
jgi:hypothetical protein